MVRVKKIVLDVLKPHLPNALEFSRNIAAAGDGYRVHLTVTEVDENTETLLVVIEAQAIDFDAVVKSVERMGGTVHSIDEVESLSEGAPETER